MTYYVLRAYTYLLGNFFIYPYNISIPVPIYTYQCGYIGIIRIYVQIRTTKIRTKIHTKYVHANTYNNTNNYVHLYVQLWIRNFNTCKYVQPPDLDWTPPSSVVPLPPLTRTLPSPASVLGLDAARTRDMALMNSVLPGLGTAWNQPPGRLVLAAAAAPEPAPPALDAS